MEPQDPRKFTVKCELPEVRQYINDYESYTAPDDEEKSFGNSEIVEEKGLSESADEEVISKKKTRGRPRKYNAVDQKNPPHPSFSSSADSQTISKRRLGRPPGSGKLQLLASLGGYGWDTDGGSFTPHVIIVAPGEDIMDRISAFSKSDPRVAICIISTVGSVSTVHFHQLDYGLEKTMTFEGKFDILRLSGWFIGGVPLKCISILLADCRCQVFGGIVTCSLIAATSIQIIVGSFNKKIEELS